MSWLSQRERGAVLGIRFVFGFATAFGRWPARQFVRLLALFYALFDAKAKRASRAWLERVTAGPVRWFDVYHHISMFAQVALDRIFLLKGKTAAFEVTRTGNEHLKALTRERRGAILLGAHLGSFEAMRASADEESFPLSIVGHFENARMINALLSDLDPEMAANVIHAGDDPMGFALEVRDRLSQGHMIAILGDRVGLNEKTVSVEFFGKHAPFPAGPFILAAALQAPVYLVFGLYYEPNRYDLFCEPFAERIELPRRERGEALQRVVQQYANAVERFCRKAPDNWFNFYDFWGEQNDESD
ncbi:MAG: lipid A biosynthesis acyltransferase [Polyangiales bacterium]